MTSSGVDVDIVVVGCGPVGQAVSIMLGGYGHRVVVIDRWPEPYPRPRAVAFDDEIARVFAAIGLADDVAAIAEPADTYDWRNAAGETLLHFAWDDVGPSGWPTANMFSQPQLENVLSRHMSMMDTVDVRRGLEATGIDSRDDAVTVETTDADGRRDVITARYVVGCDGANSFVREQLGTTNTDLGFFFDWLILDVIPHEQREWRPVNLQICDPGRPTTVVSGGPGRRRWEFMRLPHESINELNTEETAWRLLAPWDLTPANATLERHTVYTFQARWAQRWRSGRLMIAGDAAHQMPPFAGQGMCSGIRDAFNLAWKLHLVLAGKTSDQLLDSYTSERSAHIQNAIAMSVELGNVICLTDPAAVEIRDSVLLAAGGDPARALPPIPPPVLGPGVLHTDGDGQLVGVAGQLSPQGKVRTHSGSVDLLDQAVGTGFMILARGEVTASVPQSARSRWDSIGGLTVRFVDESSSAQEGVPPPGDGVVAVVDVEGTHTAWLDALDADAVLVRPDLYVFGVLPRGGQLATLLDDLFDQLHLTAPQPVSGVAR